METLPEAASLWAVSAGDPTLLVAFRTILGQTWKNGIKLSVYSCKVLVICCRMTIASSDALFSSFRAD